MVVTSHITHDFCWLDDLGCLLSWPLIFLVLFGQDVPDTFQLCGEVSKVPVPVVDREATSWISCTIIGWNSGNFQIFDCHLMLDFWSRTLFDADVNRPWQNLGHLRITYMSLKPWLSLSWGKSDSHTASGIRMRAGTWNRKGSQLGWKMPKEFPKKCCAGGHAQREFICPCDSWGLIGMILKFRAVSVKSVSTCCN